MWKIWGTMGGIIYTGMESGVVGTRDSFLPPLPPRQPVSEPDFAAKQPGVTGAWRFYVLSAVGLLAVFVPFPVNGTFDVLVGHIVRLLVSRAPLLTDALVLLLCIYGVASAIHRRWKKKPTARTWVVIMQLLGLTIAVLHVSGRLPQELTASSMVPFLWNEIAAKVAWLIPLGSLAVACLVGFGFLEFCGVLLDPVMRAVFRTPGRAVVDAATSFFGSYAVGIMVTDNVYRSGGYTARDAAIMVTGFSTVSMSFMVVVIRALELEHLALPFFTATILSMLLATIVTVRIPPLSRVSNDFYEHADALPDTVVYTSRFQAAWRAALRVLGAAPGCHLVMWNFLRGAVRMAARVIPGILAVGTLALLVARHTPVFEWLGYFFVPVAWAVRLPEPVQAGEALAAGLAEMALAGWAVGAHDSVVLRFVVGVASISGVVFFSGVVPCVLASKIPLSIRDMVIVWLQRVVITVFLVTPFANLYLVAPLV